MPSELHPGFDRVRTSVALCPVRSRPKLGRVWESLQEIRKIRHDPGTGGGQDAAAPQGISGAFLSGAAATSDPVPPAMPKGPPPHHRGTAVAALTVAGLLVLGATGFVAARGTDLLHLAARAAITGQSRVDAISETPARAALPPVPIAAAGNGGGALAAPLPTIAPSRPRHSTPRRRDAASPPPRRSTPVEAAPAVTPTPQDRSAGKRLREAGDLRITEGDIASARLFYERAANAGDARAALDLGHSFNPAFLERLGVLGMRGDAAAAARWYRRARLLGDPDAENALKTLPR
jgi:hypothetical protein